MTIVADAIKATHALVAAVPLLGEHPNEKDYEEALKELTLRAFKDDRLVYNEDWYK